MAGGNNGSGWDGLGLGGEHFKFLAVQTENLDTSPPPIDTLDDEDWGGLSSPSRSSKQSPSASRSSLADANEQEIRERLQRL